jgi:serine/threonine-protein kinase
VNRLFRWGIIIALLVLVISSFIALRIIFVDDKDITVPNVTGGTMLEAANKLQGAGLSARIDEVDSNQPEGTVISQAPVAGERTERGRSVIVRVSRGGAKVMIPDIRGKEFAAAVRDLDAAGFKPGTVIRVSDQLKPSGTVIAQNPASPSMVVNTRMVDLLVSKGGANRTETVVVPDLRGQTEALARQVIEQSDLSVGQVSTMATNQVPEGMVFMTQPRAGARVQFGGAVKIFLASPPAPGAGGTGTPSGQVSAAQSETVTVETPPVRSEPAINTRPLAPEVPVWTPGSPTTQTTPATPSTPAVTTTPAASGASNAPPAVPATPLGKIAKVRYQVPPLARSLALRIVMSDQSGTRVLREQQVNGGEYFSMDTPYSGSATVSVQLGSEQVWQERYN